MSVGVVNKQTGDRIPTAGMSAIDSALSGTSTNPVQNRVVKAALDEKVDAVSGKGLSANDYTNADKAKVDASLNVFTGTQAAWAALSTAEKKTYQRADFTDDYDNTAIGDLSALHTSVKSSIVGAVNEVADGKQNSTDNNLQTTDKTIVGGINEVKSGLINQTARSRSNITSRLTNLATAVAEQNLEKYGYKIGDYFTGASGYTYHLADMDTFYGGYNNNAIVNTHHISLVVKTGANSKWAETNDTSGGYKTSTLHSYLSSTVLDNIKSDMIALFGGSTGLEHLVSHKLLWTTATSGAWAWSDNEEYISALSEPQVYGTNVWAIDGYQTGEAWKWLEIFHKFNHYEIIGNIWWWLRSISSASHACNADRGGLAYYNAASYSNGAVGLIIFH